MNIKVQCCGVALLALFIIMYNRRRRLPLYTSKVFQDCLYVTLICLGLDIASIFGIVYYDFLPEDIPEFICKTYVAFLVMTAMLSVVYVSTSVMFRLPSYKRTITACAIVGAAEIALIYILPIEIHYDTVRELSWTSGPSTGVAYGGVCSFVIYNLIQTRRYKDHLYDRQRRTVQIWMYMWIIAGLLQFINNELLVVGFAGALSIMLVFIQFENPEMYLDRNTGLFNAGGYFRYGEQLYNGKEPFYTIAVFIDDPERDSDSTERYRELQKDFDQFLDVVGADVFKLEDGEALLIFSDEEAAKTSWERMGQIHAQHHDTRWGQPSFFYVGDPRCVGSPGELLELLRYAYEHRETGRGGVFRVIENNLAEQVMADHVTAQMIQDALDEDRVVVYYQPIYSVTEKRFTSAEALVRIVDREGRLVPPGAFIQVAESNGMIVDIGKRVFEKVCHFYQQSRLEEYGMEYIEVNLSVVQCADDRLSEDYIAIMERARIEPSRINLEITESTSTQAKQTMLANMDRMISHGVSFSLDDFGTGASNLNYIVEMPVQIVKFDRGMIQAYFESGKAKYVMDAAMQMIHGMGLGIVAEGVETEEQYRHLEEIKINFIQGYYFSKPLPETEFLQFISQARAGAEA